MSETIKNIDLTDNTAITDRDVTVGYDINSLDINQTNGRYAVVEPYNNKVVIYPQSPLPEVDTITNLQTFDRYGSLYYPLDAKFDYVRNKIWIADTGNNRVLKIDLNSDAAELSIDDGIYYPHSLSVDFNTGNIFIKAYESYSLNHGAIFCYKKDGTSLFSFLFNKDDIDSSSSSSSFVGSMSSSSSSGSFVFPVLPSSKSMVFDSTRSRLWWVDGVRIYMADTRNKQIQNYDVRNDNMINVDSIDVELSSGNAFVVTEDNLNNSFLIQINRDCNLVNGIAYI